MGHQLLCISIISNFKSSAENRNEFHGILNCQPNVKMNIQINCQLSTVNCQLASVIWILKQLWIDNHKSTHGNNLSCSTKGCSEVETQEHLLNCKIIQGEVGEVDLTFVKTVSYTHLTLPTKA